MVLASIKVIPNTRVDYDMFLRKFVGFGFLALKFPSRRDENSLIPTKKAEAPTRVFYTGIETYLGDNYKLKRASPFSGINIDFFMNPCFPSRRDENSKFLAPT